MYTPFSTIYLNFFENMSVYVRYLMTNKHFERDYGCLHIIFYQFTTILFR